MKKTLDYDEAKHSRKGRSISLKKLKKKNIMETQRTTTEDFDYSFKMEPKEVIKEKIATALTRLKSESVREVALGLVVFRSMFRLANYESFYAEIFESGFIQALQQVVKIKDFKILEEVFLVLVNVTTGGPVHQTKVIEAGFPLIALKLIDSDIGWGVKNEAISMLLNIAGEGAKYRDYLLNIGITKPLLLVLCSSNEIPSNVLRNIFWLIANLSKWTPKPALGHVRRFVPLLCFHIKKEGEKITREALWALSYLTEINEVDDQDCGILDDLMETEVLPMIINLLHSSDGKLYCPSILIIGNLMQREERFIDILIKLDFLKGYEHLMKIKDIDKCDLKEIVWSLANMATGSQFQINTLVNSPVMQMVLELSTCSSFEVRRECVWVISNVTHAGCQDHVTKILSLGAAKCLVEALNLYLSSSLPESPEAYVVATALTGILNILELGKTAEFKNKLPKNPAIPFFENEETLNRIEYFSTSKNTELSETALDIMEFYKKCQVV